MSIYNLGRCPSLIRALPNGGTYSARSLIDFKLPKWQEAHFLNISTPCTSWMTIHHAPLRLSILLIPLALLTRGGASTNISESSSFYPTGCSYSCMASQNNKRPCVHALAIIHRLRLAPFNLIAPFHQLQAWQLTYLLPLAPILRSTLVSSHEISPLAKKQKNLSIIHLLFFRVNLAWRNLTSASYRSYLIVL